MGADITSIYCFGKTLGLYLRNRPKDVVYREESTTRLFIYTGRVALKAMIDGYVAPNFFQAVFKKAKEDCNLAKVPREVFDVIDDPIKGIVHWYDGKLKAALITGLRAT